MNIKKIIEREHAGCFIVEDDKGDCFRVELANKLEEAWQRMQAERQQEHEENWNTLHRKETEK